MQLFGGMWFMLLALGVAIKIGSSLADPLAVASVERLPWHLLRAPGAVDHDAVAGKGASEWPSSQG